MSDNGHSRLIVIDADRPTTTPAVIDLGENRISDINWAGNNRLLLSVVSTASVLGLVFPLQRLVVVDLATKQWQVADSKSRGLYAGEVLYADPSGMSAIVAGQNDVFSTPSVKRVNLVTGAAEVIEKSRPDVWSWFVDNRGVVRAGLASDGRRWTLWYRSRPGEELRKIKGKLPKEDTAVDRVTFGPAGTGMILTNERTGRFALYHYDFATGAIGAPVYEHPAVDIMDVVADPITGEVSGVRYEDDRLRYVWLDPKMKKVQDTLDRALPQAVNRIADWSFDESRLLIWSGGASDPGSYYLLDRKTAKMSPVITPIDRVDAATLSPVTPVSYAARDGLTIPAYLTLPRGKPTEKLPLILMPHGGPFARDSWEYDPYVQFLASKGYAIFQPQFRGSTGYGRDFVARGEGEWGRKMQDDLDDGLDWLVRSGKVDPKRICIVGASYGGYAALWGAIRSPDRFRCAASLAGVTDLTAQLRDNRKTFEATRYYREWHRKVAGGESDLRSLSPLHNAERLKVPVLIAHGEEDDRVSVRQGRAMVEALTRAKADVSSVFYKDAGHSFSNSKDLQDFLERLERFLAKYNPA